MGSPIHKLLEMKLISTSLLLAKISAQFLSFDLGLGDEPDYGAFDTQKTEPQNSLLVPNLGLGNEPDYGDSGTEKNDPFKSGNLLVPNLGLDDTPDYYNYDENPETSNEYENGLAKAPSYEYEAYEGGFASDDSNNKGDQEANAYLQSILGQFDSGELAALGISIPGNPTTTTTTTTTTTPKPTTRAPPRSPKEIPRTLSSKEVYIKTCIELEDLKDSKILENVGVTAQNTEWRGTIALAIERMTNPSLVEEFCENKWNTLPENQRDRVEAAVTRATHCQQPTGCNTAWDLSGIWGYGCWCNLDSDNGELTTGTGLPVNEFDQVCQKLQLCLRCARFDNKGCDPNVESYNSKVGPDFLNRCSEANPNDGCGTSLCTCHTQFFSDLLNLMWTNTPYDPLALHTNPDWDQSVCDVPANPNSEMDCCGEYPARYPFNIHVKTCCNDGRTIFTQFEQC